VPALHSHTTVKANTYASSYYCALRVCLYIHTQWSKQIPTPPLTNVLSVCVCTFTHNGQSKYLRLLLLMCSPCVSVHSHTMVKAYEGSVNCLFYLFIYLFIFIIFFFSPPGARITFTYVCQSIRRQRFLFLFFFFVFPAGARITFTHVGRSMRRQR
jgi:hypothetical protein